MASYAGQGQGKEKPRRSGASLSGRVLVANLGGGWNVAWLREMALDWDGPEIVSPNQYIRLSEVYQYIRLKASDVAWKRTRCLDLVRDAVLHALPFVVIAMADQVGG